MTVAEKLQTALVALNILVILGGFIKLAKKPSDDLKERVVAIEVKQKDIELSLEKGNKKFQSQSETNEVLLHSVFALIEFEMQYCLTEGKMVTKDLENAKDALHKYMYRS